MITIFLFFYKNQL